MIWKKSLIVLLILLFVQQGHGQLERYKYIVVPLQFEGFNEVNQFRTSTLIKFLFSQEGYNVVYDNKIPPDLASKPCSGLRVRLVDDSSLFLTKVRLALEDCYGQVVFETLEGKSKIKEYEPAFREAIEDAFEVLVGTGYTYNPSATEAEEGSVPAPTQAEQPLDPPSPEDKPAAVAEAAAAAGTGEKAMMADTNAEISELLYAQPVDNGFQLVDSSPKVRMKLVKSTQADTYIAMVDDSPKGMVYKKEGHWWHEYYEEGKVQLRKLRIKF